jgi:hypothetical protein
MYMLQIEAGEPLLLSYGNLSNDFLFMDYGFIIDGNPHDRVTLRFDIDLMQVSSSSSHLCCWGCLCVQCCAHVVVDANVRCGSTEMVCSR